MGIRETKNNENKRRIQENLSSLGGDKKGKAGMKMERMDDGNRRRTQRQPSRTGRTSGAGPIEALEETLSGLCPRYNLRSRMSLHTHRGSKYLEDLRNQEKDWSNRAMFTMREHGRILGDLQQGQDGRLPEERKSRQESGTTRCSGTSLRTCHGNGGQKETIRLHVTSCTKTGWSSLNHNRVLHHAVVRFNYHRSVYRIQPSEDERCYGGPMRSLAMPPDTRARRYH